MAESDGDTFRYRVEGTSANGELTVRHITDANNKEVVKEARLRLSNGTLVQIIP
ncbi:MAG TPA: hypothetical protein VF815_03710 [Myxococcaceae bacterium]|jgi:hypothetical protein